MHLTRRHAILKFYRIKRTWTACWWASTVYFLKAVSIVPQDDIPLNLNCILGRFELGIYCLPYWVDCVNLAYMNSALRITVYTTFALHWLKAQQLQGLLPLEGPSVCPWRSLPVTEHHETNLRDGLQPHMRALVDLCFLCYKIIRAIIEVSFLESNLVYCVQGKRLAAYSGFPDAVSTIFQGVLHVERACRGDLSTSPSSWYMQQR